MFCAECGHELRECADPIDEVVKGVQTHVEGIKHFQCDNCGEYMIETKWADKLSVEQSHQVASAKGLLNPDEIRALRHSLGLTQTEFERILGVGKPTCSRWENGVALQSRTTDRLMRVIIKYPHVARFLAKL